MQLKVESIDNDQYSNTLKNTHCLLVKQRASAQMENITRTQYTPSPTDRDSNMCSNTHDNASIAKQLIEYAGLLEQQGSDGFRERAYRKAAATILQLDKPLETIFFEQGWNGLVSLPGIGKGIAGAITEIIVTGRWSQLERLHGDLSPEHLFLSIPGIGPVLAARLVNEHHFETLQDLQAVVLDSKTHIDGFGPRRRAAIRAVLAERLKHPETDGHQLIAPAPPVELILEIDALYRQQAHSGALRKIAPRSNNPEHKSWLPIMHVRRDQWHFTTLFSNTARAHQLGKTNDWVIIYYQADSFPEGRCTVVTETRGERKGLRVVRGREIETPVAEAS